MSNSNTSRATTAELNSFFDEILLVGTYDTKARELRTLKERLLLQGARVKTVDLSLSGKPSVADITPQHIVQWHPDSENSNLQHVSNFEQSSSFERGRVFEQQAEDAVIAIAIAFKRWLESTKGVAGVVSVAGQRGTALLREGLQSLPAHVPKVIVSTANSQAGCGLQSNELLLQAVVSAGQVRRKDQASEKILAIAADAISGGSMYAGLMTGRHGAEHACTQIGERLQLSHECISYQYCGVGSASMTGLASIGRVGLIDLACAELIGPQIYSSVDGAGEGVVPNAGAALDAGLSAAQSSNKPLQNSKPYIGSVASLDTIRFAASSSIPANLQHRVFFNGFATDNDHASVTLMRTSAQESEQVGVRIAEGLNRMTGPVRFLLPLKGISTLDAPGQAFHNPLADRIMFDAIRGTFESTSNRELLEIDEHINSAAFADAVVAAFNECYG